MRNLLIIGFVSFIKRVKNSGAIAGKQMKQVSKKKLKLWLCHSEYRLGVVNLHPKTTAESPVWEHVDCFVAFKAEILYSPVLLGYGSSPCYCVEGQGGIILTVKFVRWGWWSMEHGLEFFAGVAFGVSEQKLACEENRHSQSPAPQPIFSDFNGSFSCIKTRDKPAAEHTHEGFLWLPVGLRCGREAAR